MKINTKHKILACFFLWRWLLEIIITLYYKLTFLLFRNSWQVFILDKKADTGGFSIKADRSIDELLLQYFYKKYSLFEIV